MNRFFIIVNDNIYKVDCSGKKEVIFTIYDSLWTNKRVFYEDNSECFI